MVGTNQKTVTSLVTLTAIAFLVCGAYKKLTEEKPSLTH